MSNAGNAGRTRNPRANTILVCKWARNQEFKKNGKAVHPGRLLGVATAQKTMSPAALRSACCQNFRTAPVPTIWPALLHRKPQLPLLGHGRPVWR